MSKKKTGDASADDEKGGHVRLSTEISRMLGWVWYLEREKTGQTQAQIVEELIRLGLAKRYGTAHGTRIFTHFATLISRPSSRRAPAQRNFKTWHGTAIHT